LTHHDALPGTGLFNVTQDYMEKAERAMEELGNEVLGPLMDEYLKLLTNSAIVKSKFQYCQANRTCDDPELFMGQDVIVSIYNPNPKKNLKNY
jgi:hypothetical protein